MPKLRFAPGFLTALTLLTTLLGPVTAGYAQQKDSMLQFQIGDQLKQSASVWNRGDLEGFLGDYLQSEELTFTSGGRILRGYEALRARYEKSYGQTRDTMGQLSFSDIEVWSLGTGRALVLGRWKIDRQEAGATTTDDGVFSLVMVQVGSEWKIFHDHTSLSAER
jgi:ketosteroid isomerase-like protein